MNKIIQVHHNKRDGSILCLIPMNDENNSSIFDNVSNAGTWVYYCDGQPHMNHRIKRHIPVIVMSQITDIWGGECDIRDAGYRKHWQVFQDTKSGKYYFGNYPMFAKSTETNDRIEALNMFEVDIEMLMEL